MKRLFIGLIFGSIAAWGWYHTGGKIHITEIKTVTTTNEIFVTITETQTVEQLVYVTRTNEVWKTNIVEKLAQVAPVAPVAQKKVKQSMVTRPVVPQRGKSLNTDSFGSIVELIGEYNER